MADYRGKPIDPGFENSPNYFALRDMEEEGTLKKFAGMYIGFADGKHQFTESTNESLRDKLEEFFPGQGAIIQYIPLPGEEIPVIRVSGPRVNRS